MNSNMAFMQYTDATERRIVRKLLAGIFALPGGASVRVHGETGDLTGLILNARSVERHLAHTGSDTITIYQGANRLGFVWLVWGNGEDVITDYTDTPALHEIIEPLTDG